MQILNVWKGNGPLLNGMYGKRTWAPQLEAERLSLNFMLRLAGLWFNQPFRQKLTLPSSFFLCLPFPLSLSLFLPFLLTLLNRKATIDHRSERKREERGEGRRKKKEKGRKKKKRRDNETHIGKLFSSWMQLCLCCCFAPSCNSPACSSDLFRVHSLFDS